MKAAYIKELGPPEKIIFGDMPEPVIDASRAPVKVGCSRSRSNRHIHSPRRFSHESQFPIHHRTRHGGRCRGGRW